MSPLKMTTLPVHESPLVSSVSDASGLKLKSKVSELFGQMKELGSSQSGSLRDLRHEHSTTSLIPPTKSVQPTARLAQPVQQASRSSQPNQVVSRPPERPERGPVCTNKAFQSARAQQAAIENSVLQHSRSFNSGLNGMATTGPAETPTGNIPMSKSLSNAANLTSLCADISPCNSHFFEVLYIGKIKVSHKKVPESLIDDALSKFKQLEDNRIKAAQMRRNSLLSSQADSLSSDHGSLESLPGKNYPRKVEFTPLPLLSNNKVESNDEKIHSNSSLKEGLQSPSLTPLTSTTVFFPDDEKLNQTSNLENKTSKETSVDREFDEFSVIRVQNKDENANAPEKTLVLNKKSFPVALEPKVLVLNWSQKAESNKMSTLNEVDVESSKDADSLTSDSDSAPDFDKLLNNIKLLKQTDGDHLSQKDNENKNDPKIPIPPTEKGVLKSTETKIDKKVDDKTKKRVEFKMKNDYLENEQRDIEKESLQERNSNKTAESIKQVSGDDFSGLNRDFYSSLQNDILENRNVFKDPDDEFNKKQPLQGNLPENKQFARDRSASIGSLNLKTPIAQLIGDQNRTMLFQVGRSELRLISPDRKQVLLHRHLRDVSSCCQGILSRDHLGFICREPERQDCLVGYIFKCQSEGVANDVVGAITQAFVAHTDMVRQGRETSPIFSCEHCPMVWYHKLCQDLEGLADKRIHTLILRRIEYLCEDEQNQIITKYQGGTEDLYEVGEHNAFLMMLLRAHCEAKQQRHVHDTAENRSEFLNQYLGGSTIFMKAKRSLSISFDHLLKRKATKDDLLPNAVPVKKESSPNTQSSTPTRDSNNDLPSESSSLNKGLIQNTKTRTSASTSNENLKDQAVSNNSNSSIQNGQRESTPNFNLQLQNGHIKVEHESSPTPQLKSPMMDIFMKLGNAPSPKSHSSHESHGDKDTGKSNPGNSNTEFDHNTGSWRQAIFNRITREGIGEDCFDGDDEAASIGPVHLRKTSFMATHQEGPRKRTKKELRDLWKKGINQAILLIRMEKENARLRARQEVSAVKRIKLEYEDIGGCANENSKIWDMLTAPRESRLSTKVDSQKLHQAIRHGVPRAKRGDVWYFLAEQYCLRHPPPDTKNFPNYGTPYEVLLKQLTSHQHAILIDLGRTFPSHTYFSSPLGPGQLALFNLLKAYSLLDPEVGYCQGLSFVAGVLLLHLDEAEAFLMLRHLMFRRGLRKQYLPDMVALQIQLYQLSRLVKDHLPELYDKFDQLDVSPTLYAAPWILTIFTSQFPLGFVTRVFDLLFLESSEVIFRVAIALLDIHKDGLMLCDSFEEIMEYLKYKIPNIDKVMLDKVIKLSFTLDFARQLHEYHVEYNVLQEEMAAIAPKMEALVKMEKQNEKLLLQNKQIKEQFEDAMTKVFTIQKSHNKLENQVKSLEQTVAQLARFIGTSHDKKKDSELPNDIRRLCQQVQQNDRKTLGVLGQKLGQNFSSKFALTDFSNGSQSGVSEESGSDIDEKYPEKVKKPSILKTGLSTSSLFQKIGEIKKEDNQKPVVHDPVLDKKRQYLSMKKSMSCNAGLMTSKEPQINIKDNQFSNKLSNNLKGYPLRVLDEDSEHQEYLDKPKGINKNLEILKSSKLSNASSIASSTSSTGKSDGLDSPKSKGSGFFAHSHEQIRQEKLQAEQLKRDFDENLKRLDARLSPNISFHDKAMSSPITHSFVNPTEIVEKLKTNTQKYNIFGSEIKETKSNSDSGLGTPISPNEKSLNNEQLTEIKIEDINSQQVIADHPLVGCDLDIKFDVHSSKLKSIKPTKITTITNRNSNIAENISSRN